MTSLLVPIGTAAVGAAAYYGLQGGTSPVADLKRQPDPKTADHLSPYPPGEPVFVTSSTAEAAVNPAKSGIASLVPSTVMQQFYAAVKKQGEHTALRVERDGAWQTWTWKEYRRDVERAARAFMFLGVDAFDAVSIVGFNAPEWFFANVGAIAAGAKAAGIYATNEAEACWYIADHSGSRVAVVENVAQLEKFLEIRDRLPKLNAIVLYMDDVPEDVANDNKSQRVKVYNWKQFMALADKTPEKALAQRIDDQRPGHCCTLIYTSGTTGHPKAVMMSHDNLTWTAQSMFSVMPPDFGQEDEHVVSYLPLSHIAAQMLDIHMPMGIAALYPGNAIVHFARPDALKGSLGETLRAARPTVFFGVPRVWEKISEKMKALGKETAGLKKTLVTWAKSCGAAAYAAEAADGDMQLPWGFSLAQKLVLSKIRVALGLDRCKMCFTGAAPISKETLLYFGSLYIPVFELYGMSECSGPATVCSPGLYKVGSCGQTIPGIELKIQHDPTRDQPGEGEIIYRGRHIMMGYLNNEEKSREAIDPEGWLHSGDVGRLDEDGFLFITGRIKELIITAGGENIAPVPIEAAFKKHCPAVSNIMMVGDKRKYNVCLITLRLKPNADGTFSNELDGEACDIDPSISTVEEAKESAKWKAYLDAGLKKTNAESVSRAAKIQRYAILTEEFSVPGGELTSTLKLRRGPTTTKYQEEIEALYS